MKKNDVAIATLLLMGWHVKRQGFRAPGCERFKDDDCVRCTRNATLIAEKFAFGQPLAVCRSHARWAVKKLEKMGKL